MIDIADYWDRRYREGGDSGAGSRGEAAQVKADRVNALIREHGIGSIADWGCGDGEVLSQFDLDGVEYVGVDISTEAVAKCLGRRPGVTLIRLDTRLNSAVTVRAEMALSMDVVFHFPDEADLVGHLGHVFGSASRLVLLHGTDRDGGKTGPHVRHRRFTPYVEATFPEWKLTERPPRDDLPGFYLYERR